MPYAFFVCYDQPRRYLVNSSKGLSELSNSNGGIQVQFEQPLFSRFKDNESALSISARAISKLILKKKKSLAIKRLAKKE